MQIKQIAIFHNPLRKSCAAAALDLAKAADAKGIVYYFADYNSALDDLRPNTDIVFCIGGDGTILKASRAASIKDIKIIGINAGHLGFLAAVEAGFDFSELLEDIKKDNFILQRRMMISAKVVRNGNEAFSSNALNEAIVKAACPRTINLRAQYAGLPIKDYTADGLLLSTPTGSTAYNLAAGGPIVYPDLDVLILTPICPHTLNQRPLLLPGGGDTVIEVLSEESQSEAILSLDGQINFPLRFGDKIVLSKYKNGINILFPKNYDFFNVLSIKLRWNGR